MATERPAFVHPDLVPACPPNAATSTTRMRGPTPAQHALVGRALRNRRHTLANVLR